MLYMWTPWLSQNNRKCRFLEAILVHLASNKNTVHDLFNRSIQTTYSVWKPALPMSTQQEEQVAKHIFTQKKDGLITTINELPLEHLNKLTYSVLKIK